MEKESKTICERESDMDRVFSELNTLKATLGAFQARVFAVRKRLIPNTPECISEKVERDIGPNRFSEMACDINDCADINGITSSAFADIEHLI